MYIVYQMALRSLKKGVIYGPVHSKRLGRSLGLNILPPDRKVCTFDCVYCHYGHTVVQPFELPEPRFIEEELREYLSEEPEIDFITFAGHGEPTLHTDFLEIVRRVKKLRDEMAPNVKIALLTNSSKLSRPDVAEACELIDSPICKLDAGDEETFKRISRPNSRIYLEDIISGIRATPRAVIQAMIIEGSTTNASDEQIKSLVDAIKKAKPTFVQVYSIDFPFPEGSLMPAANEKLERIARIIREEAGIDSEAYWESK